MDDADIDGPIDLGRRDDVLNINSINFKDIPRLDGGFVADTINFDNDRHIFNDDDVSFVNWETVNLNNSVTVGGELFFDERGGWV